MPTAKRYSKKREAILEVIRGTRTHPTADWVYQQLKPLYPDLSLGTVYRNLTVLREENLLRSVGVVNGQERFDAIVEPHAHFVCERCGAVIDLPGVRTDEEVDNAVDRTYGVRVDHHDLVFHGTCRACTETK